MIARSLTAPDAFGLIFDRHFTAIHRYLARRVGRDGADDLAAQTFTVAFERRASFRPESLDARPWLFGIATNLLLNSRRSEQRTVRTLERLGHEPTFSAAAAGAGRETDSDLSAALRRLDAEQLDVLLLYAWAELSYEEIAESLGVPVGTVRSRLSRARAFLRDELEPAGAGATVTQCRQETS